MIKKPILLPIPKKIICGDEKVNNSVLNGNIIVQKKSTLPHEGYNLTISQTQIFIESADDAGTFYAKQTLKQLQQQYHNNDCPVLQIEDFPDIAMRGISLDVSRDRIMPFKDLLEFVDLLASWKINTFTLYFEHVFAYKNHEKVWKNVSPFTAEDIQKLDKYCKERFIDLIPCQETLGHLTRWLCHEPYRQLAECPGGCQSSWRLNETDPFSLCPTDPKSLEFIESLLDELLPNFSSEYFYCGGDETSDVGKGRSKEICDKIGVDKVYGDYFKEIGKISAKHGRKMIIYADMVKNNIDACKYLPKDAILAEWGYGRNYPFIENAQSFIDCGLKFCILSSNSNYSTFGGRTYRWRGNIVNAVSSAIKLNALGYFNHEFGDFGHWTQFSFSIPGFAYGAALSWNYEGNKDIDLGSALDLFAYNKCVGLGDLIIDIGKIYNHTAGTDDSDALYCQFYFDELKIAGIFDKMTSDNLAKAAEDVITCTHRLHNLVNCPEKIQLEIKAALKYINFAIQVANEVILNGNVSKLADLPIDSKKVLAKEFAEVIETLLEIRDKYYLPGGRYEALCYLKRYWQRCCNPIPFPERFLT